MLRKGLESRARLIQTTSRLMAVKSLSDLTVAEIAREAGCSKSNFYLYFGNVLDAVLAAVKDVSMGTPEILQLLNKPWVCYADTCAFLRAYLLHWRCHKDVLRVRLNLSMAGEQQFIDAELAATVKVFEALTAKIAAHQSTLSIEDRLHAPSSAGALLAMIERMAAYGPVKENDRQITEEGVIDAMARIINKTIFDGATRSAPANPSSVPSR